MARKVISLFQCGPLFEGTRRLIRLALIDLIAKGYHVCTTPDFDGTLSREFDQNEKFELPLPF